MQADFFYEFITEFHYQKWINLSSANYLLIV